LNVGAGVSIEKNAAEAKEILKIRKAEVLEGSRKLNEVLAKIDQEMQKIQAVMQQYEEGAEQHQHEPSPGSDIVV
jgi:prefoldin alpha subunit